MSDRLFPVPILRMASRGGRDVPQQPYLGDAGFFSDINREAGAGEVSVKHELRGTNLVSHLLSSGVAKFACVVCVPSTMYRVLDVYDGGYHQDEDKPSVEARQKVPIEDSLLSSPPFFRSLVIAVESIEREIDRSDGLYDAYLNKRIFFPEGSILAAADWIGFHSAGSLMVLQEDASLKEGTIHVDRDTQHGYRFIVRVHPRLFGQLRVCPEARKAHRNSILTHALSRGLEILAKDYGPDKQDSEEGDGWKEYANLRWLQSELKSKNYRDWTEENFHAEEAATRVRGHEIPGTEGADDGDD